MSGLDRKKHCAEGGLEAVPPALSTLILPTGWRPLDIGLVQPVLLFVQPDCP